MHPINKAPPNTKRMMIPKIAMEDRPVTVLTTEYRAGPMTAANFPKISKKPKHSLERSGGIILPK